MLASFWTGAGFGFLVAAQVGPIWLLCARSALRGRLATGVAIGAGAALVDLLYASLGAVGSAQVLGMAPLRLAFGAAGAAVLVYLGGRTLWSALRIRAGMESEGEVAAVGAAFRTALAATASNPLTIASWGAIFTAAGTAHVAHSPLALVLGVGCGSFGWFLVLSLGLSVLARRLPAWGLRLIDLFSGLGLVGFGLLLGARTVEGR